MPSTTAALLVALTVAASGCARPTRDACSQACANVASLRYAEGFERRTQSLADQPRLVARAGMPEALRNDLGGALERPMEACIAACEAEGSPPVVECVREARTADDAQRCLQGP